MSKKVETMNSKKIAAALKTIDLDSRYLNIKINEFGLTKKDAVKYIKPVSADKTRMLIERGLVKNEVASCGRGRPASIPVVTGKGRGYIALSKNWK